MITRYNYEEYFLLYVDNELSATERNSVEKFVQQNPDLEGELNMLKQSVIKPENHIVFENKNLLLKQIDESSAINLTNYEEYFLLYIDNELDASTKKQVDEFVNLNPSLQNEFHLFQQTKLQPDNSTVFEGKESLYKKEERRRPILFAWIASAAAVAVLLVTGFLFFNRNDGGKKNPTQSVANNNASTKKEAVENKKRTSIVTSANPDSLNNPKDEKKNVAVKEIKSEKRQAGSVVIPQKKMKEEKTNEPDNIAINTSDENTKNKSAAVVQVEKINNDNDNRKTTATEIASNKLFVVVDIPVDNIKNNDPNPDEPIVSADNDNDSEKKTKLRGIFRKVSRVFNKTTNADDDTKRSVAIGSFQIALK